MNIFRKRGSTFYRRFPAAGPPSTTDFRLVWAVLLYDPGSGGNSFMCHSVMCLFGAFGPFSRDGTAAARRPRRRDLLWQPVAPSRRDREIYWCPVRPGHSQSAHRHPTPWCHLRGTNRTVRVTRDSLLKVRRSLIFSPLVPQGGP